MGTSSGQNLVDLVKDHLGERVTGQIGSRGVDDACLASVNKATRAIVKKYNLSELQTILEVDVSSSTNTYDLPTATLGPHTSVPIKNIEATPTLLKDGETSGTWIKQIYTDTLDKLEPYKSSTRTGRPNVFSIFNQDITLYPYPDDDYILYLKVNLWPPAITLAQFSVLDDIWDDVIEAYATFDAYAKLQQTADAASWYGIYKDARKETRGCLINKPSFMVDSNIRDLDERASGSGSGTDPALDPFNNYRGH